MSRSEFVILAHPRTGSTYLKTKLSSHPQIVVYDELFHPIDEVRAGMHAAVGLPEISSGEDPVAFLDQHIFIEYPASVRAVGFKLMYQHALNPEWQRLRQELRRRRTKIMHLKRRNRFSRYLSQVLSDATGVWMMTNGASMSYGKVHIDPCACFHDFAMVMRLEQEEDSYFSENPKLEIIYENLIASPESQKAGILEFLEVDAVSLSTDLRRQRVQKKSEIVENYDELRQLALEGAASWGNSEWPTYFD